MNRRASGWWYLAAGVALLLIYLLCEKVLLLAFATGGPVRNAFSAPDGAAAASWLLTAIFHSSALSTSLLVNSAADGTLQLRSAVHGTFHAAVGTTVSAVLVALLLYVFQRKGASGQGDARLRAALTTSTCHAGFALVVCIFASPFRREIAALAADGAPVLAVFRSIPNRGVLQLGIDQMAASAGGLIGNSWTWAVLLGLLMFACLFGLSFLMHRALGWLEFEWDSLYREELAAAPLLLSLAVTALFKSSSVTTCLLIPVAAERLLNGPPEGQRYRAGLRLILDVVIGANIGTTVTAALVALDQSGGGFQNGATVAIAHMMMKLGGLLLFSIPWVREKFLDGASYCGSVGARRPWAVVVVVGFLYYLGPWAWLKWVAHGL